MFLFEVLGLLFNNLINQIFKKIILITIIIITG